MTTALDLWRIVVIGPLSKDWLLTTKSGNELVLSSNGRAYPTSELARVAPALEGLPVFHRHASAGTPGTITRFVPNGSGKVGTLTSAWWDAETRQIRAWLTVESEHWHEAFLDRRQRGRYGFSWTVDAYGRSLENGVELVETVARLFSVDLEETPAAGGRFINAPAVTRAQERLQWELYNANVEQRIFEQRTGKDERQSH